MAQTHKQQGSAHVVAIIVLVLVLIAALGWIFWQNFIHKEPVKKDTEIVVVKPKDSAEQQDSKKTDSYAGWKQYCSENEKSCFKYPSSWTADSGMRGTGGESADYMILTSKNGSTLDFESSQRTGLGGACDNSGGYNISVTSVKDSPHVSGLYIVSTTQKLPSEVTGRGEEIRTNISMRSESPKLGNTGMCLDYPSFMSRNNTYNPGSYPKPLSVFSADIQSEADRATIIKIFESYTY